MQDQHDHNDGDENNGDNDHCGCPGCPPSAKPNKAQAQRSSGLFERIIACERLRKHLQGHAPAWVRFCGLAQAPYYIGVGPVKAEEIMNDVERVIVMAEKEVGGWDAEALKLVGCDEEE